MRFVTFNDVDNEKNRAPGATTEFAKECAEKSLAEANSDRQTSNVRPGDKAASNQLNTLSVCCKRVASLPLVWV